MKAAGLWIAERSLLSWASILQHLQDQPAAPGIEDMKYVYAHPAAAAQVPNRLCTVLIATLQQLNSYQPWFHLF